MRTKLALLLTGILGTVFPKVVINGVKKLILLPSYENPDDLEPRDWLVTAVRVQSFFLAVVALYTMTGTDRSFRPDIPDAPELTPSSTSEE